MKQMNQNKQVICQIHSHVRNLKEPFLLHKIIFVLQKKYKLTNYPFMRADYGPFSYEMQEDIESLEKINFNLEPSNPFSDEIIETIQLLSNKSRKELLHYIYHTYDIFNYELRDPIL